MSTTPTFRLNPFGYLFRVMWGYVGPQRPRVVLFYGLQIIGGSLTLAQPFAIGMVINTLQVGGPDVLRHSLQWLAVVAGCNIVSWLFWGPARHIERIIAFFVYQRYTAAAYKKLTELPLAWHQDHHSGATINRVRTAGEALRDFSQDQYITIRTVLRFVVASGMLLWISPAIGVATLAAFLLLFVVIVRFDKVLVKLYQRYNEGAHQLNATFFDYVSNMTTLLILRLTALSAQSLATAIDRLRRPFVDEVIWNEVKWAVMDITVSLISVLTLAYYIVTELTVTGSVALGTVMMIYQYQSNLSNVVSNIGVYYGKLVQQANSLEALDEIDAAHVALARPHRNSVDAPAFQHISITNLALQRTRDTGISFALDVPRLTITRGEKIALIGTSGGGKSTLLCLLCGIYSVDRGDLAIDGAAQPLSALNDIATLIPQDPEIFENTIRFNITLGVEASEAEVMRAVELSGFAPVLAQLPQGLATDIREKGVNLSVGQKQRLALARGFFAAAHSAMVLLDEPTSSVDLATEEQLFDGLFGAFPDKTIVASMHRLHLLPRFDRVWLMDNGRLVIDAPAQDALTQPGPVRDMFERYSANINDE